jgi:dual specificity phosphatase 12
LEDEEEEDLLSWLDETYQFIDGGIEQGGSVLVHCTAGISRSLIVLCSKIEDDD